MRCAKKAPAPTNHGNIGEPIIINNFTTMTDEVPTLHALGCQGWPIADLLKRTCRLWQNYAQRRYADDGSRLSGTPDATTPLKVHPSAHFKQQASVEELEMDAESRYVHMVADLGTGQHVEDGLTVINVGRYGKRIWPLVLVTLCIAFKVMYHDEHALSVRWNSQGWRTGRQTSCSPIRISYYRRIGVRLSLRRWNTEWNRADYRWQVRVYGAYHRQPTARNQTGITSSRASWSQKPALIDLHKSIRRFTLKGDSLRKILILQLVKIIDNRVNG